MLLGLANDGWHLSEHRHVDDTASILFAIILCWLVLHLVGTWLDDSHSTEERRRRRRATLATARRRACRLLFGSDDPPPLRRWR